MLRSLPADLVNEHTEAGKHLLALLGSGSGGKPRSAAAAAPVAEPAPPPPQGPAAAFLVRQGSRASLKPSYIP